MQKCGWNPMDSQTKWSESQHAAELQAADARQGSRAGQNIGIKYGWICIPYRYKKQSQDRASRITNNGQKQCRNSCKNTIFFLGWCQGSCLQNGLVGRPTKFFGPACGRGTSHQKTQWGAHLQFWDKGGTSHLGWSTLLNGPPLGLVILSQKISPRGVRQGWPEVYIIQIL